MSRRNVDRARANTVGEIRAPMWGAPMWRVRISCLLALLAGWVDVICVVRYGAFAVTQTGNLIFMGMGLHSVLFRDGCDGRTHRSTRRGAQAQGSSGGSEQDHFMACLTESEAMQQVFFTFIVLICSLLGAYAYAPRRRPRRCSPPSSY